MTDFYWYGSFKMLSSSLTADSSQEVSLHPKPGWWTIYIRIIKGDNEMVLLVPPSFYTLRKAEDSFKFDIWKRGFLWETSESCDLCTPFPLGKEKALLLSFCTKWGFLQEHSFENFLESFGIGRISKLAHDSLKKLKRKCKCLEAR